MTSSSRLSPQLFAILRHLVEEKSGLHYRAEDADVFADKLLGRMAEAGFESALDYYYRLRYDDESGAELNALVDALVVGETYFFREVDAVRAAIRQVVEPAIRERGRAVIWSAACATGEEPLSVAVLLAEAGLLDRSTIRATDISQRAIARAREGRYGGRSLRALHDDPNLATLAERWLGATKGSAQASPRLLAAIDYEVDNLVAGRRPELSARFDLVLCRNVLIYFADDNVQRVVGHLADALRPDGRLLVGASESLLRFGTRLRCEERSGTFFYAKDVS